MNPARALRPMLTAGALHGWWIFVAAPVIGAVLATVADDRFIGRAEAPAQHPNAPDPIRGGLS